jgi:hypothetical protein
MFDVLIWAFAAIGAAVTAFHGARFTCRAVARGRAWAGETRALIITRIEAPPEMIDLARRFGEAPDDVLARLLEANPHFTLSGTARRNDGRSERFERQSTAYGGCLVYPSTLDVMRAIAGERACLPAVDFRLASVEAMATAGAQAAA